MLFVILLENYLLFKFRNMYNSLVWVLLKLLCAQNSILLVLEVTLMSFSPDVAGGMCPQYCAVAVRPFSVPKALLPSQTSTACYRLSDALYFRLHYFQ